MKNSMNSKKKVLMIMVLTIILIISTGCIQNKGSSKTEEISQNILQNQNGNDAGSIIKISDLPKGFNVKSRDYITFPKNTICTIKNINSADCIENTNYKNWPDIPKDRRFGGSKISINDDSGVQITVTHQKFDNVEGIKEKIDLIKTSAENTQSRDIVNIGNPNIGDYSIWITLTDPLDKNIIESQVIFLEKGSLIKVYAKGDKSKSLDKALEIAKIAYQNLQTLK